MKSQPPSRLPPNRPPECASPNLLDHSLGVHLWAHSILAPKWMSKLTRTPSPSASLSLLNLSLRLHLQTSSITASKSDPKLARSWPPNASPNSFDHGLQVCLQTCSISAPKCISKLAPSRPPRASLGSLNLGLQLHLQTYTITALKCISAFTQSHSPIASQMSLKHSLKVHLWVHSILASMCISKLAQSRPPGASLRPFDAGMQVHLQNRSSMASKNIFKEQCWVYEDREIMEVDWATGSIYLGDPGVDRYHLIFISSYHTTKIPTLSFPTFALTRSFRDFVDPRNSVDPHGQVVSYLLTVFLRSSSWNCIFSGIPLWCRERCGGMLMVGSLPSTSIISAQWPQSGSSRGSFNWCLQVPLLLCSTTICRQMDHRYIYRDP